MTGSSYRARKTQAAQSRGFSRIEMLLIVLIIAALCLMGYSIDERAEKDIRFNDGFNERAGQYQAHIGEKDPFIGMIAGSMTACGDYSRVAAQMELEKSKENTDTIHYRLHQAGRESFDACMNQHLTDLQSTLKDDRLVVLQDGLECDKGCPMPVIKGLGPWKDRSAMTLTHVRRR